MHLLAVHNILLPAKYQALSKHSTLQVVVLLAGYVVGLADYK